MEQEQIKADPAATAVIPLTKGYSATIDAHDLPLVQGKKWCVLVGKKSVYAVRNEGPRSAQKMIYMHRLIARAETGEIVDHKDGNGLNNTRENLRIASPSQNVCNARMRSDNSSGVKGVFLDKRSMRWSARVSLHGNKVNLGSFSTKEAAAAVCEAARKSIHGEFARNE